MGCSLVLLMLLLKLGRAQRAVWIWIGRRKEKENKLLTEQGDGLFMALTNFGYVPKCCQLLVGNSQKHEKWAFFFFKAVSAVSIREVSKNLEMNAAYLWLMAVKENIFKMGIEIRMQQSKVICLTAYISESIPKKKRSFFFLSIF